jgi:hypothetical protein
VNQLQASDGLGNVLGDLRQQNKKPRLSPAVISDGMTNGRTYAMS